MNKKDYQKYQEAIHWIKKHSGWHQKSLNNMYLKYHKDFPETIRKIEFKNIVLDIYPNLKIKRTTANGDNNITRFIDTKIDQET